MLLTIINPVYCIASTKQTNEERLSQNSKLFGRSLFLAIIFKSIFLMLYRDSRGNHVLCNFSCLSLKAGYSAACISQLLLWSFNFSTLSGIWCPTQKWTLQSVRIQLRAFDKGTFSIGHAILTQISISKGEKQKPTFFALRTLNFVPILIDPISSREAAERIIGDQWLNKTH